MERVEILLIIISVLLFFILVALERIAARLKAKFPTEKEEGRDWAQKDPMGHWEAHKKDKT
jgi:flagellar basal body-associated protein FliL